MPIDLLEKQQDANKIPKDLFAESGVASGGEVSASQVTDSSTTKKPMIEMVNEKLPEGQKFSFGNMVSNIPSSAGKLVDDVTTMVTEPVETAESLWNVASGFVDKGAETLTSSLPAGS